MDLNDEVKLNLELVDNADPLIHLKNASRYLRKYERYELEKDYVQAYNSIEKAINYSDSKMNEKLVKVKELIANMNFEAAINNLSLILKRQNSKVITFSDKNLESIIRETISLPQGNILSVDVEEITYLDASNKKISNLQGISYLTNLRNLDLSFNAICDQEAAKRIRDLGNLGVADTLKISFAVPLLKPEFNELNQLDKLESLNLSGNSISDISFLKGLNNLTELNLGYCRFIDDISPISTLLNLEKLILTHNMIENIEVLGNMQNLRTLDLSNNKLRNINPLGRILSLEDLDLSNYDSGNNQLISYNSISDIQPLIYLPNLRFLDIDSNPVRKVNNLSKSKSLESVRFNGKNIENLSELGGFYFDFKRLYTKPVGCLVSLSILVLLVNYTINSYSNNNSLGGLPIFAFAFPVSVLMLWESYRTDDAYNKVRGWVILTISFLFLLLGSGYQ